MSTRARRDYYEILGVSRGADRETIRRAFRVLAAEHHPDVSEDPKALERFREIAEAYEVLSRPETRERYDRYGFDPRGVGGFDAARPAGGAAAGLFDDLVEQATREAARGGDVELTLRLELSEAMQGGTRPLRFATTDLCEACAGVGAAPGTAQVSCRACGGRGRIREQDGGREGFHLRTCGRCGGSGRQILTPCEACGGSGRRERERLVRATYPAGVGDGAMLRLEGQGHAGEGGGMPGDVVVHVSVETPREPAFARRLALVGVGCATALLVLVVLLR